MNNIEYDKNVPAILKEIQIWFSDVITQPIINNSRIQPIAPSGKYIEVEAASYIKPNHCLEPAQRIEIYNQQYWWRLLNALHENYPFLTLLLGYKEFNQKIGFPFLQENPPNHWSLSHVGMKLPHWVNANYKEKNRQLIYEAATIDGIYVESFIAGELNSLDEQQEDQILSLQPHLHLCQFLHNILPFREQVLEHDFDYWKTHSLPKVEKSKEYYFVIYRDYSTNISWLEIDSYEYKALSYFKEGKSVDDFCGWLEKQSDKYQKHASKNIHLWFQNWSARGFLGTF